MNIYPAIDLYHGKVVRLERGDFKRETVYSDSPDEIARWWESEGASWLHVVDLEGAKTGVLKNRDSLLKIRKSVQCKIQFGGGLRDPEVIGQILAEGIDRVVLGTKAIEESFLKEILAKFGSRIAVGLDTQAGRLRTEGWTKDSSETLETVLEFLDRLAVATVIYTDIQRDGMMQGPDFSGLKQVLKSTKAGVILSGGVTSLEDIEKSVAITDENFDGVIIGRSLYEKKLKLKEAIAKANEVRRQK